MKTWLWCASVLIFLFALWSCATPQGSPTVNDDPVILEAGDATFQRSDFAFYLRANYPELTQPIEDEELLSFIFDKFVRDMHMVAISELLGFRVPEDQVESFIAANLAGLTQSDILGDDEKLWRDEVRRRLTIRQFLQREIVDNISITDEMINAYYEANQEDFKRESHYAVRIVQTSDEAQADAFIKDLRKSKTLFKDLAPNYAEGDGWRIAVPMSLNDLPEPFRKPIRRMKPGQYSKVIPIQQGEMTQYVVLYLETIQPEMQIPFEEAYQQILSRLEKEQRAQLLDAKIQQFEPRIPVKTHYDRLSFAYVEPSQRKEV